MATASPEWRIVSLVPYLSSRKVAKHFNKIISYNTEATAPIHKFAIRSSLENKIGEAIGYSNKKTLAVYGSGSYHHCTYGLCSLAKASFNDFSYFHIDHHSDYRDGAILDCGNFVRAIIQDKIARDYFFIGGYSKYASASVSEWVIEKFGDYSLEHFIKKSKSNNVYISIDLDVMSPKEISTSIRYEQGHMSKEIILNTIKFIKSRKNIISADILGYTYSFSGEMRMKAMQLYEDIAREILGKDEWELHLRK